MWSETQKVEAKWTKGALWGVNLCAISACTLNYIYLSYYIYQVSSSVLLSELVLFAPMVMPVLLVWRIHRLSQRFAPRSLMIWGNCLGVLICALVFGSLHYYPYVAMLGAVVIGTLDAIQRVARIVAVKHYFSADQVKLTVPLTFTAQFIAGGLAGGLLSVFKQQMTPSIALVLTCLLFVLAALSALPIPKQSLARMISDAGTERSAWRQFADVLRQHPEVARHFVAFVLFVTFFQGFFNVSRVTLPAHQLGLAARYVGLLQVVNSGAALIGALLFYWGSRRSYSVPTLLLRGMSALSMVAACASMDVLASYSLYFAYIFFFELVFFKFQAELVSSCPPMAMPLVATIQYAAVYLGMMIAILAGAMLAGHLGLFSTALIFAIAYFALQGSAATWLGRAIPETHQSSLP